MASYRGVSKTELIDSINNAFDLLETYSAGPACQKLVDDMRKSRKDLGGQSGLGAIIAAQDDVTLAAAVSQSGAEYVFSQLSPLLQFHAAVDTDGFGREALENLTRWDATSAALFAVYTPMNAEIDAWLVKASAERIANTEENQLAIARSIKARTSNTEAAMLAFDTALILLQDAENNADLDKSVRLLKKLDPHAQYLVVSSLTGVVQEAAPPVKLQHALGRYGILICDFTQHEKLQPGSPETHALRDAMDKALEPFYETSEVTMTGIGIIADMPNKPDGSRDGKLGVTFVATRRAAQAVADALPDQTIIDNSGTRIPPTPKTPDAKPGPRLQL